MENVDERLNDQTMVPFQVIADDVDRRVRIRLAREALCELNDNADNLYQRTKNADDPMPWSELRDGVYGVISELAALGNIFAKRAKQ